MEFKDVISGRLYKELRFQNMFDILKNNNCPYIDNINELNLRFAKKLQKTEYLSEYQKQISQYVNGTLLCMLFKDSNQLLYQNAKTKMYSDRKLYEKILQNNIIQSWQNNTNYKENDLVRDACLNIYNTKKINIFNSVNPCFQDFVTTFQDINPNQLDYLINQKPNENKVFTNLYDLLIKNKIKDDSKSMVLFFKMLIDNYCQEQNIPDYRKPLINNSLKIFNTLLNQHYKSEQYTNKKTEDIITKQSNLKKKDIKKNINNVNNINPNDRQNDIRYQDMYSTTEKEQTSKQTQENIEAQRQNNQYNEKNTKNFLQNAKLYIVCIVGIIQIFAMILIDNIINLLKKIVTKCKNFVKINNVINTNNINNTPNTELPEL